MLYTLADARTEVGPFVDGGSCNTTVIDARINQALERLLDRDYDSLKKIIRLRVCNHCIALPYNVETVMWVDINGTPSRVFGMPYQFLSSGPGDLDYRSRSSSFQDLVDKGDHWPVMFDIPESYEVDGETYTPSGMRLLAVSQEQEDAGKTILVRGFADTGVEVRTDGTAGEELTIHRYGAGVDGLLVGFWDKQLVPSTAAYTDVTRVVKPRTRGYVTLYAVDTINNYMYFLAKYHPDETVPSYRRYQITNACCSNYTNILALVKLRYVPLVSAEDVLPIDSLQALKFMIMALREENAANLAGSEALEDKARRILEARQASRNMTNGTPVILNQDYRTSLGRALNKSIRI